MVIPKGYKNTEVGVIPEDWDVISLGKIADIKTGPFGSSLHAEDYVSVGIPIITVEHLGEIKIEHTNLPLVSKKDVERLKKYSLKQGDIVFSRVGSVDRNSIVSSSEDGWLFSGRLLRIRLTNDVCPDYLSYHFKLESSKRRIKSIAVGQTMPSLNTKLLASVLVSIPNKNEQPFIASVLTNLDNLIESLEKLIAKKKLIKEGAMQDLLTGKKRLAGFDGEWEICTMNNYFTFQSGFPFSSEYFNRKNTGIRLIKNRDLKSEDTIIYYSSSFDNQYVVNNGDLLLGMDGDFLPCLWKKGVALLNQRVARLIPNKDISSVFAYYALNEPLSDMQNETGATTVKHLSHYVLDDLAILMPPTLEEQNAIASILTDMDTEIDALESKLAKYRRIKAGAMQQLLTGNIRLPAE